MFSEYTNVKEIVEENKSSNELCQKHNEEERKKEEVSGIIKNFPIEELKKTEEKDKKLKENSQKQIKSPEKTQQDKNNSTKRKIMDDIIFPSNESNFLSPSNVKVSSDINLMFKCIKNFDAVADKMEANLRTMKNIINVWTPMLEKVLELKRRKVIEVSKR